MRVPWNTKMQCGECKRVQMAAAVSNQPMRAGTVSSSDFQPCRCGKTAWSIVDDLTPVTPDPEGTG